MLEVLYLLNICFYMLNELAPKLFCNKFPFLNWCGLFKQINAIFASENLLTACPAARK